MLAEKTNLSKVFRALDNYTQPPSPLKKTFKTKVKRKQKLVAATITCLLWRSKSFREKVQSLYFPERYYFRGDRAKSIKKSDPSIFYCCCNLSLLWIFCVIEHKIINLSSPSRPKFKNKSKTKTKISSSDHHLWSKDVYKAFRVFLFPLNDII